jgi:hypothetical protein
MEKYIVLSAFLGRKFFTLFIMKLDLANIICYVNFC